MGKQIGAEAMRKIGRRIEKEIPGLGFMLIVFEFHEPGMANYLSNALRHDMIKAMEETVARLKGKQDFKTPEEN